MTSFHLQATSSHFCSISVSLRLYFQMQQMFLFFFCIRSNVFTCFFSLTEALFLAGMLKERIPFEIHIIFTEFTYFKYSIVNGVYHFIIY